MPRETFTLNQLKNRTKPLQKRPQQSRPEPTQKKPSPLQPFLGKRVFVQRNSTAYIGILAEFGGSYLVLLDAKIIGTERTVEVPRVAVQVNHIAHLHEAIDA